MAVLTAPVRAEEALSYNRDIRPILSNNCFMCHGPDKAQRKAGLRLDEQAAAHADHDGARPIVPGDPANSDIIKRILTLDADDLMPPPDSGKVLTPEQKATLQRWVAQGGSYEAHWAYIPPKDNGVPSVDAHAEWVRNPIDQFILATLERQETVPSPEADKTTLLRRLSFDVVGLPPSPEDIDAFLADNSEGAYERAVDRLLASPQYGERMAVDWLDIVRYADTNGYHGDEFRSVYPYRDYVINAFNANMRYDQFTIEQLAGDLLPDPTRDQLVAAAYNRLNQITAEGGAQAKEYLEKYAADRVRTTAGVWMSATFGCAQCHDHKYDPYSMRDFYSFSSFFADIEEKGVYSAGQRFDPLLDLPTKEQEIAFARIDAASIDAQRALDTPTDQLAHEQRLWEQEKLALISSERKIWSISTPGALKAKHGTELKALEDGSVLGSGPTPDKEVFQARLKTDLAQITGVRLEALPDASLPNGLSRGNGNFILSSFGVSVGGAPVAIVSAKADYEQATWPIANALDEDPNTGWAVDGHVDGKKGLPRQAVFKFAQPLPGGPGAEITVQLHHVSNVANHAIGRFRLSLTAEAEPDLEGAASLPDDLRQILLTDAATRTPEQVAALAKYFRSLAPSLDPVRAQLAALSKEREELQKQVPVVLLTRAVEPRPMRILPRGNWMDESGEVVQPATPEFLPTVIRSGEKRLTRLDLAQWIVSKDNPLTARVYMNRLWAMYFGTGISKVLDDLGIQGEWPTHPELLDWLALEFMNSGWDVKHMARLMLTSSAYRQSSLPRHDLAESDPYNRLLARQARFRLPAEFVRDNALSIAGVISLKIGGPVVRPYQPDGYYNDCNTFTGPMIYDTSQGEDQYRRGLYTFWKRSFLHPSMLAFDAPSREECTAVRTASNTPLQALVLLNDPSYVEAARVFAERILREGGADTSTRLRFAFRRAVGRVATEQEIALLTQLLVKHQQEYAAEEHAATDLLALGQHPAPGDVPPAELAAWTSVARALLNLHETITRS